MSRYDLIVVGGGPGGSAAAKEAADNGLKVIILERGRFCGEKNSSGFGLSPKAARDFDYIKGPRCSLAVADKIRCNAHRRPKAIKLRPYDMGPDAA